MTQNLANALIKEDFYSFVQRAYFETSGGQILIPNWHLEVLCDRLEKARKGQIKRLIINVPPRSLKSQIVNVAFTTWVLGHNPTEKIVSASYSAELAETFARDCKRIMQSEWYKQLFPKSEISNDQSSAYDFKTISRGGRFAASVEGSLTGRGGNIIIIDDPIKTTDMANENALNKVQEWYTSTLLSRLDNQEDGVIILIMQRVHENDLTGYLLDKESDKWEHIVMPMIATEEEQWDVENKTFIRHKGDVLNKQYISFEKCNELKIELGEYVWNAQYQQEPCPVGGGIVKEEWMQYYPNQRLNPDEVYKILLSWDTANKTGENNAYSACSVVAVMRNRTFYLLQVARARLDMTKLLESVLQAYNSVVQESGFFRIKPVLLIEDAASGTPLINLLRNLKDIYGRVLNIEAIKPKGDKIDRLYGITPYIENGQLLFPPDGVEGKERWWPDFKKELLSFPNSKYKDQVDSLTQAISYGQELLAYQ